LAIVESVSALLKVVVGLVAAGVDAGFLLGIKNYINIRITGL
jgi:hypothetical protein